MTRKSVALFLSQLSPACPPGRAQEGRSRVNTGGPEKVLHFPCHAGWQPNNCCIVSGTHRRRQKGTLFPCPFYRRFNVTCSVASEVHRSKGQTLHRSLVSLILVSAGILAGTGLHAQSPFYSNTTDAGSSFVAGAEIAMPVAFTGSFEVDSFKFGYFLPQNSASGPTTDAIINFYTAAQPAGDAYSGYDPVQQNYLNLVSSTRLTDLAASPAGVTKFATADLTAAGDFFQFDSALLATGETGGWVSIEFTNPDAGWELATGDSKDDVFQNMTNGDFENLGPTNQAAFDLQLSGRGVPAPVPESSTWLPFVGGLCLITGIAARKRLKSGGGAGDPISSSPSLT